MTTIRKLLPLVGGACVVALVWFLLAHSPVRPVAAQAGINPNGNAPPFDFNDAFYTENGINVSLLDTAAGNRVGLFGQFSAPAPTNGYNWIVDNSDTDPIRNNVRITQTTGGFNKDGNLIYYDINAFVHDQTWFTQDAAGVRAHQLADSFRAFVFPKQIVNGAFNFTPCSATVTTNCIALSPAPSNRREDNLFDTKNTYFCQNLLGLWVLTFPIFTSQAINTANGQAALAKLAAVNGTNLDGTPVLKRANEVDNLTALGLVQEVTKPEDGSLGFRWVV